MPEGIGESAQMDSVVAGRTAVGVAAWAVAAAAASAVTATVRRY